MEPQGWSSQDGFVYIYVIDLINISGVQSLSRPQVVTSAEHKLKVTLVHDTKQKEIGEFSVIFDKCTINKKINCKIGAVKSDDLGKLHVYIDQAYSPGLVGHIPINLKEFVAEQNQLRLLEYPLWASELRGLPKLLMAIQCSCLQELKDAKGCCSIEIVETSTPEVFLENQCKWKPLFSEENTCHGHPLCMPNVSNQPNKAVRQVQRAHEYDSPKKTLQKLEGMLLDLDMRLSNVLSTFSGTISVPKEREALEFQKQRSKSEQPFEDISECFVCSDSFDIFEGISTSLSSSDSCSNLSDSSTSCKETEMRIINLGTARSPNSNSNSNRSGRFSTGNLLKLLFVAGISALGVRTFQKQEKCFYRRQVLHSS